MINYSLVGLRCCQTGSCSSIPIIAKSVAVFSPRKFRVGVARRDVTKIDIALSDNDTLRPGK